MIGVRYMESLESGVLGAILIHTGMILAYAVADIIEALNANPLYMQDDSSTVFWVWALAIVPVILVLVGMLTAWLDSKFDYPTADRIILITISAFTALVGGALLLLFISAFLSPPDFTSSLGDRLAVFTDNVYSVFTSPYAWAMLVVYLLIGIAGGLLYSLILKRKPAETKS